MNIEPITLESLFNQLGLKSSENAIKEFLHTHSPLPEDAPLFEAKVWTASQALFLKESIEEDSDWAQIVDRLSCLLQSSE